MAFKIDLLVEGDTRREAQAVAQRLALQNANDANPKIEKLKEEIRQMLARRAEVSASFTEVYSEYVKRIQEKAREVERMKGELEAVAQGRV